MHPDTLLSAEEIAALLSCHRNTVYRLWKSGKLAKANGPFSRRARSTYAAVKALGGDFLKAPDHA